MHRLVPAYSLKVPPRAGPQSRDATSVAMAIGTDLQNVVEEIASPSAPFSHHVRSQNKGSNARDQGGKEADIPVLKHCSLLLSLSLFFSPFLPYIFLPSNFPPPSPFPPDKAGKTVPHSGRAKDCLSSDEVRPPTPERVRRFASATRPQPGEKRVLPAFARDDPPNPDLRHGVVTKSSLEVVVLPGTRLHDFYLLLSPSLHPFSFSPSLHPSSLSPSPLFHLPFPLPPSLSLPPFLPLSPFLLDIL